MGTDPEPRPLRIEPHGERLGTQWGPGPFTIEQTTEDVTADPPLGREQAPRATATSPPAAGRQPSGDPRRLVRPRIHDQRPIWS